MKQQRVAAEANVSAANVKRSGRSHNAPMALVELGDRPDAATVETTVE